MSSSTSIPPQSSGFLLSLLSPPLAAGYSATTIPPSSTTHRESSILPRPRARPLKPGSQKESALIAYLDKCLLEISRRYEKRFQNGVGANSDKGREGVEETLAMGGIVDGAEDSAKDAKGYTSFGELARHLGEVADIVWVSGTPSLQTPYLLTIALTTSTYLPSFTFAPQSTFRLLRKLDYALASLLKGVDAETGVLLPGLSMETEGNGRRVKVSVTEKVRIRGVVETTRVKVVEVAGAVGTEDGSGGLWSNGVDEMDEGDDYNAATSGDDEDHDDSGVDIQGDIRLDGNHSRWEMEIARVYERTLIELGLALDIGTPVSGGFG